jgi:hypothetical protein
VLKIIEEEQEVWESLFRTLADLGIKRAVDTGWLSELRPLTDKEKEMLATGHEPPDYDPESQMCKRDLGYDFSLPNPLKRAMSDLIAAITTIAAEFDPTNQNVEMQRFLLGLALEQGFDIPNPQRIVMDIYPPDYEAPAPPQPIQMMPDGSKVPTNDDGEPTATGGDGRAHPAKNPYGAQQKSATPESNAREEGGAQLYTSMLKLLEEAADGIERGLPPRPDDPHFQRDAGELLSRTQDNMRELVTAAGATFGSGKPGGAGSK